MIVEGRVGSVDLRIDTTGWPPPTKNMMTGGICSIIQKTAPSVTITYLQKIHELLADLPRGLNVLELFGGIGMLPLVVGPTIKPASWVSVEWDPWCEANFMEPRAAFWLRDVYHLSVSEMSGYDLIVTDCGYTLYKYATDENLWELMADIAEAAPIWWMVTDIGRYWSHLHRPQYKKQFGVDLTDKDSYTALFAEKWGEWFGYKLIKTTFGGGAEYYLFERAVKI